MDEQNRLRLARIAERHTRRGAGGPEAPPESPEAPLASAEEDFRAQFLRTRDAVIRPAMLAVTKELELNGYRARVRPGGMPGRPAIDLHVELPARSGSRDIVRFFPFRDPERGWQIVAELELKGKPFELRRFERFDELQADVLEHVLIDAIEQMFSSTASTAGASDPAPHDEEQAVPTRAEVSEAVDAGPSSEERNVRARVGEVVSGAFPPIGRQPEQRWASWATQRAEAARRIEVSNEGTPTYREERGAMAPRPGAVPHATTSELQPPRPVETDDVDLRAFRAALPFMRAPTPPATTDNAARWAPTDDEGSGSESMSVSIIDLVVEESPTEEAGADDSGDRTLPPRSEVARRPALPFAGPSHRARPGLADERASGMADVATRPFALLAAATAAPDLSLDEYARFRARLSVEGEEHPGVWRDFGVSSLQVKEALQARFAARFRQDPAAQTRFLEELRRMADELRAEQRKP